MDFYLASDDGRDFLNARLSTAWQSKLKEFEQYFAHVESKSRQARIPLIAAVLPTRAEATMIAIDQWPTGLDPYKFGEEVRMIVERNGGTYIDLLHSFSRLPDTDQFYYPVDGHPNARGQSVFASLLAKGLIAQDPDLTTYNRVHNKNLLQP